MDVEIDEVVSTIRVTDRHPAMDPREMQRLVEAVLRAVDSRLRRDGQRAHATAIDDDGRGGVSRAPGRAP